MKRDSYVKDEIFVVRDEGEATPKMESPCEEKNGDGNADHPDHREDRKTYHGESRHWDLYREKRKRHKREMKER